jgi:hypothetical protein
MCLPNSPPPSYNNNIFFAILTAARTEIHNIAHTRTLCVVLVCCAPPHRLSLHRAPARPATPGAGGENNKKTANDRGRRARRLVLEPAAGGILLPPPPALRARPLVSLPLLFYIRPLRLPTSLLHARGHTQPPSPKHPLLTHHKHSPPGQPFIFPAPSLLLLHARKQLPLAPFRSLPPRLPSLPFSGAQPRCGAQPRLPTFLPTMVKPENIEKTIRLGGLAHGVSDCIC